MPGGFHELLEELFGPLEGVTFRRMFGGVGVFRQGMMFALVDDDVLYLKADEATSPAFAAEGSSPWTYPGMRGATTLPYWRLPERLLDEPEEFRQWALTAFAVAERKKAAKKEPAAKKAAARKPAAKKPATRKPAKRKAAR
jgi:DNA transformation protein